MTRPPSVSLVEVGPRDGLQNESVSLTVEQKFSFIENLVAAGLRRIEAGAFVRADRVPQMAATAELCRMLRERKVGAAEGVRFSYLVPNERGMQDALAAGAPEVSVFTAASETFNQKNINCSVAESIARFRPVMKLAAADGIPVRGYVSTVFACPYEGKVAPEKSVEVTDMLLDIGVGEVSLGDTIGAATPADVSRALEKILARFPAEKLALHMHDTGGRAVENVLRGYSMGIAIFDASAGGLGGCPYAPGAQGNVATEDVAEAFAAKGVGTGVDMEKLCEAALGVGEALGRVLPSRALAAWKSRRAR